MSKVLMSNKDYHAAQGEGSTLLKAIDSKSVIHAIENPFVENDASIMGGALHAKLLMPESLEAEFIVCPKMDKRTKAGKEAFAQFQEQAVGKSIISEDNMGLVDGMAKAIVGHDLANKMLSNGEAEFSYFTECKETGLGLKCRPDYVNKDALIDLKSARDASPREFAKAIANFKYHIQAAYYLDVYNAANGTDIKDFYFVVVENSAPFAVAVYKLDELAIEHGRERYKKALRALAEFRKDVEANSMNRQKYMYGEGITELQLPNWAFTA